MDRNTKVSTVTPSKDVSLTGQRSKRSKFQTLSNSKSNSVSMLGMDRHAKVSTVTPSWDLTLRGQRSKGQNFKLFQIAKLIVSVCLAWIDIQKCQR